MFEHNAIHIDVVGARFRERCLTHASRIFNGQNECVLIVEFLHVRTGVPHFFVNAILLLHHSKNALLSEGGVQCQNAHQREIRCNACDQYGPENINCNASEIEISKKLN